MRLYRICRVEHLEDYSGLGASYRDGGRWNEAGLAVLYFAETASVAMLEMANYLPSRRLASARRLPFGHLRRRRDSVHGALDGG